jgi:hypothetical protein
LARTVYNPTDIFDIVESKFPYSGFKQLRIASQQRSNGTFDDIYLQFKVLTNLPDELISALKEFEITTEINNTIPICCNISKINDGDILVSDMYLSEDILTRLIRHNGISKDVKIYVSPSGKHNGSMWTRLNNLYKINSHLGDNVHSDIEMAKRHGILGIYTDAYKFTHLEKTMLDIDVNISNIFRRFRLSNPYDPNSIYYKLYNQQIQYNIPLLLHMCRSLEIILKTENRDTVLFLSRDGCLIIKLFMHLYPQYKSIYFDSSRLINKNPSVEYLEYVKGVYNKDKCILFDLHGSFKSGRALFMKLFNCLPRIYIFDVTSKQEIYDGMSYTSSISERIEELNPDIVGTLVNFNETGAIRAPCDINKEVCYTIHSFIDKFINYIHNNSLEGNILRADIFSNKSFWADYYKNHVIKTESIYKNMTDHKSLTQIANDNNSDKGDTYECAHKYTIKYEELIHHLVNNMNIPILNILEIGLNRANTKSIPSLMMWREYIPECKITGFDIKSEFLSFNNKYDNIHIKIGDQSNPEDLSQLKSSKYHLIVDDGYHASKHQQITFKTLWDNLEDGGYYVIEDLHWQPIPETCVKTRDLFEKWYMKDYISTEYISKDDLQYIIPTIQSIEFYDSKSKKWNNLKNSFVYIRKGFISKTT